MSAKNAVRAALCLAALASGAAGAQPVASADESAGREGTTPIAAPRKLTNPIDFSGYIWVDTGQLQRDNRTPGTPSQDANYMQGRFVLVSTYERSVGDLTALARLELAGLVEDFTNGQYAQSVLDAFVQLGQRRWDVRVGRFLAWEVYYRGQGIELFTPEEAGAAGRGGTPAPTLYHLDFARGHATGPGQAAVHFFPFEALGLEVAAVYGQQVPAQTNAIGIRPSADFRLGGLGIVGGYEYLKLSGQQANDNAETTRSGYAARVQYRFGAPYDAGPGEDPRWLRARDVGTGVTIGANFAQATVEQIEIDGTRNTGFSFDKTSVGGFVDLDWRKSSLGLGYHRTTQENERGEKHTHDQAFVSYLHRLPIDGLSLKAVYGFALAELEDVDVGRTFENDMQSFRVRVAYEFR